MLVAETLCDHLQANGHVCQIFDDAALTDIDASRFLLIVTATTGQGGYTPNLRPLPVPWPIVLLYEGWRLCPHRRRGDSSRTLLRSGANAGCPVAGAGCRATGCAPGNRCDGEDEPEVAALAWLKIGKIDCSQTLLPENKFTSRECSDGVFLFWGVTPSLKYIPFVRLFFSNDDKPVGHIHHHPRQIEKLKVPH